MGLLASLENLDGVEDSVKGLYKESDNGFVLDVEPVGSLSLTDVSGLKSALEKERANNKTLNGKLGEASGMDIKAAREALAKVESMKNWKPEDKVNEQISQKMAEQKALFDIDLKKVSDEKDTLFKQVDKSLRQSEAMKVLTELKGNVTLLMPHIMSQTQTVQNADGSYSSVVVDAAGNPRVGGNDGSNMTIAQLIENMNNDDAYAAAFEGSGQTGTGATGNVNRGGSSSPGKMTQAKFDTLSDVEKSRVARSGCEIT